MEIIVEGLPDKAYATVISALETSGMVGCTVVKSSTPKLTKAVSTSSLGLVILDKIYISDLKPLALQKIKSTGLFESKKCHIYENQKGLEDYLQGFLNPNEVVVQEPVQEVVQVPELVQVPVQVPLQEVTPEVVHVPVQEVVQEEVITPNEDKEELTRVTEELANLRNLLKSKETELEEEKSKRVELEEEKATLEREYSKELNTLKTEINTKEESRVNVEDVRKYQKEIKELQATLIQNTVLVSRAEAMKKELSEATQNKAEAETKARNLEAQVLELEASNDTSRYIEQIKKLRLENTELEKNKALVDILREDIDKLEDKNSLLNEDLDNLRVRETKGQDTYKELEETYNTLKEELEEKESSYQKELQEKEEYLSEIQTQVESEKQTKATNTAEKELEYEREKEELQNKLSTLKEELESKEKELEETTTTKEELEKELEENRQKVEEMKLGREELELELSKAKETKAEVETQKETVEEDLRNKEEKLEQLEKDLKELLEKQETDSQESRESNKVELNRLTKELQKVEEELDKTKAKLQYSTEDVKLKKRYTDLELKLTKTAKDLNKYESNVYSETIKMRRPASVFPAKLPLKGSYGNICVLAAGSAESNYTTYNEINRYCRSIQGKQVLVLDLSTDTSVDSLFGLQSNTPLTSGLIGDIPLSESVKETNLAHVKLGTVGLKYTNPASLVHVDWSKVLEEASKMADIVLIYVGVLTDINSKILYNSFSEVVGKSHVVVKATPTNIRTLLLLLSGLSSKNKTTVACIDYDTVGYKLYTNLSNKYKTYIVQPGEVLQF